MIILPLLLTISGLLGLLVGIAVENVLLIGTGAFLFLSTFVLPALCMIVYEMTPAYARKKAKETKEFNTALNCIDDLVELSKNKTEENIMQFKSKWPSFAQQITSSDIMCKIACEKGVWKLFNKLAEEATKED